MKLSERCSEYHKKHPRMHTYLRAHILEYGYVILSTCILYTYIYIYTSFSQTLSLSLWGNLFCVWVCVFRAGCSYSPYAACNFDRQWFKCLVGIQWGHPSPVAACSRAVALVLYHPPSSFKRILRILCKSWGWHGSFVGSLLHCLLQRPAHYFGRTFELSPLPQEALHPSREAGSCCIDFVSQNGWIYDDSKSGQSFLVLPCCISRISRWSTWKQIWRSGYGDLGLGRIFSRSKRLRAEIRGISDFLCKSHVGNRARHQSGWSGSFTCWKSFRWSWSRPGYGWWDGVCGQQLQGFKAESCVRSKLFQRNILDWTIGLSSLCFTQILCCSCGSGSWQRHNGKLFIYSNTAASWRCVATWCPARRCLGRHALTGFEVEKCSPCKWFKHLSHRNLEYCRWGSQMDPFLFFRTIRLGL